ncbi:MAG TPA: pitrilysin family protein, partial [bacterium]|nr:pitrilysin family protein [bacterium]
MQRRTFVLLFLSLSLTSLFAQTDETIPMDPAVRSGVLSNGLRYFIKTNARPEKRVELRLAVNTGSIMEDDDQLGLAHFVEHMAFNGTTHFQKNDLISYLQSAGVKFGAHINAYTSFDETVYMLTLPSDKQDIIHNGFLILEDWAHGITFDSLEIEKERGVVIEEWRTGIGAQQRMSDQYWPKLFYGSRYAERMPIGKKEILEKFSHASIKRFYKDWYRPELMSVIAVGDIQPDSIEYLIRKHFSNIATSDAKKVRPRNDFPVPPH